MTDHAAEARRVNTTRTADTIAAEIAAEGRWWDVDRVLRMNGHELAALAASGGTRPVDGQLELFPTRHLTIVREAA